MNMSFHLVDRDSFTKNTQYGRSKPIEDGIYETIVESMSDFAKLISKCMINYPEYIWRGQLGGRVSKKWLLEPALDRVMDVKNKWDSQARMDHLKRFQLACRGRIKNPPNKSNTGEDDNREDDNEWWAIGQHHGLTTPLLDWTTSPFVAAYFAFIDEVSDHEYDHRVLYGLNRPAVEKMSEQIELERKIEFIDPTYGDNPRLVNQGGLFTRSPAGVDIETWIRKYFKGEKKSIRLRKIYLDKNLRDEIIRTLNRMNINHLSLFPDLIGASIYTNLKLTIDKY